LLLIALEITDITLSINPLSHLPGFNFQVYAFLRLQITDYHKQVTA